MTSRLEIAVVLYEGMTSLDAAGPTEVLRFLPGAAVRLVAAEPGPVATDIPGISLIATDSFDDVRSPDVVVVPGGPGTRQALDGPVVPWLAQVHPTTAWTTSVCSGSLLLGAAGLLDGAEATSHFAVADLLPLFGARPVASRVVALPDRRVITAAGVSSGIDMALELAGLLADDLTAQAIQLVIEYDPQPRYSAGSLATAAPEVVRRAVELGRPHGAIPETFEPPGGDSA